MKLPSEALTEVSECETGFVTILQPEEECGQCGERGGNMVSFSPSRARVVAAELIRLAGVIESKKGAPIGFEQWCDIEDKKCATTA